MPELLRLVAGRARPPAAGWQLPGHWGCQVVTTQTGDGRHGLGDREAKLSQPEAEWISSGPSPPLSDVGTRHHRGGLGSPRRTSLTLALTPPHRVGWGRGGTALSAQHQA